MFCTWLLTIGYIYLSEAVIDSESDYYIISYLIKNLRFFSKRDGEEPGFKESRGQGFKGDKKLLIAHSLLSAITDERLAVFT